MNTHIFAYVWVASLLSIPGLLPFLSLAYVSPCGHLLQLHSQINPGFYPLLTSLTGYNSARSFRAQTPMEAASLFKPGCHPLLSLYSDITCFPGKQSLCLEPHTSYSLLPGFCTWLGPTDTQLCSAFPHSPWPSRT